MPELSLVTFDFQQFSAGRVAPNVRGGRIETTNFWEILAFGSLGGLDMAGEHRLLDQRTTFETSYFYPST